MKKVFIWILMAAIVGGLSFAVTSCKDDDDEKSGQKKDDVSPLDTDEARVAFRWLCALTDATTLDDNWKSKTYEPTVGQASENNEYTRIVVVSSLDEAKEDFSRLADMEASELAKAQTVNGGAAGTMTWTPSKAGAQNLAVVEVKSRIMPHLQRLVYCTADQVGLNGYLWDSMKGVAYYRLGDVVRDRNDYYWVCVRPAFAPDKADSHWINIFNASASGMLGTAKHMPSYNICDEYNRLEKYDKKTILLPTKLAYDRQHIYNLSNLIWALLDPVSYHTACNQNSNKGLCTFEYGYHGEKFLNTVAAFWDRKYDKRDYTDQSYTMWEKLFGLTHEQMLKLRKMNFYYQGYSWWFGNTPDFWVYKSTGYVKNYSESGKEKNDKVTDYDVVANGFDITRFTGSHTADQNAGYAQFVMEGNNVVEGTWVVRYAKGSTLCSTGKYSEYERLGGCTDVYVYNKEKGAAIGPKAKQETEQEFLAPSGSTHPKVGNIVGSDGLFYPSVVHCRAANVTPAAIVVYYDADDKVEAGTDYHGLAMALEDAPESKWVDDLKYTQCGQGYVTSKQFKKTLNGLATTNKMYLGCGDKQHTHPVATACRQYEVPGFTANVRAQHHFSEWFLPSAGQMVIALETMKMTWSFMDYEFVESEYGNNYNKMIDFLENADAADKALNGSYWTSSEADAVRAYYIFFDKGQMVFVCEGTENQASKNHAYKVRPFIAFANEN